MTSSTREVFPVPPLPSEALLTEVPEVVLRVRVVAAGCLRGRLALLEPEAPWRVTWTWWRTCPSSHSRCLSGVMLRAHKHVGTTWEHTRVESHQHLFLCLCKCWNFGEDIKTKNNFIRIWNLQHKNRTRTWHFYFISKGTVDEFIYRTFFQKEFWEFQSKLKDINFGKYSSVFWYWYFLHSCFANFQKYSAIRRKDVIYVNIFLLLKNSTYTKTHQLYLFTMHKTMSTYFFGELHRILYTF